MELTSPSFADGETIPERFTKDHGNVMPALNWRGAPTGTESYLLVVEDPDAPKGTVRHLAVAGISAEKRGLGEGEALDPFTVGKNVFGETGWGGPRPPAGDGPHHYHFKLLALDIRELPVADGDDAAALIQAAEAHVVAQAEMVGVYENKAPARARNEAVRIERFGGPDVLQVSPVDIPQAQDDEVLVKVFAASLNPVDYKMREGKFPPVGEDKLPLILGRDLAGTIEAVGTRAHYMLSKGDPVFALVDFDRGTQSRYVVVKALELVAAPKSLDLVHAAAVPLAAMTAWQGLFDHGGLRAGQRVLIHGGAGGVGHFAVQFAKAKGATVFATAGEADLDFVRDIGADTAIDHKNQRFEDVATDIDLVFDLVGGETQDRSWAVLREGGTMVSTLTAPDPQKAQAHNAHAVPHWTTHPDGGQLREIAGLIDIGQVKVVVSETFPLSQMRDAYDLLENGDARGKIVLMVEHPQDRN